MLRLIEYNKEISCRTLNQGQQMFHHALRAVLNGEKRFHVKNDKGENYDLEYVENNTLTPNLIMLRGKTLFPPYFLYDEEDREKLYLDIINAYSGVIFNELNEYSIVLANIILQYTEKEVFFSDKRILWFVEENERLHIMEELPDYQEINALCCNEEMRVGYGGGDFRKTNAIPLFHNVFVWQWLTDLPLDEVKYIEIDMGRTLGIGGVLSHFTRFNNVFAKKGWKTVIKHDSSRYKDDVLKKYFKLHMESVDSDEQNTVYVSNLTGLIPTYLAATSSAYFNDEILSDEFVTHLKEYKDAVIGNKRVLGILIRGTDYIVTKMPGTRKMATVEQMLPMIREWMEQDKYDCIFLATEDQDVYERMMTEFKGKIRVIAQERHRVSDFKDAKVLNELEKQEKSGLEYEAALEDTTVNYFYALYLLSQCESFMCSGYCNGWDVVNSFHRGEFKKKYLFQVGLEQ